MQFKNLLQSQSLQISKNMTNMYVYICNRQYQNVLLRTAPLKGVDMCSLILNKQYYLYLLIDKDNRLQIYCTTLPYILQFSRNI